MHRKIAVMDPAFRAVPVRDRSYFIRLLFMCTGGDKLPKPTTFRLTVHCASASFVSDGEMRIGECR